MPKILHSKQPEQSIPDVSVTDYVLQAVERCPDRPALIDGEHGTCLTYRELDDRIRRLAGGLLERGFGRRDVLAILAPNCPEYAVAFHGVAAAGGTVTTINPTYTADEVSHQLNDSGSRLLLTTPELLDTAREASRETGVRELVVLGDADGAVAFDALFGPRLESFPGIDPREEVAALPYSSGTTGLAKGVMLTHRNLVANLIQFGIAGLEDGTIVAALPFFHIYGMQVLMNQYLALGGTVITQRRFDLQAFLEHHQQHRCSHAFVVPPILLALARQPMVDDYDLSALRSIFCAAAPLAPELAREAAARLGCEVVQGYGMTEASPGTHLAPPGGYREGSVGMLVSNTECRIVDPETGDDVATGEPGEIWVRGPQVMRGYLNRPEATRATVDDDGWLHTGDIGRSDEDGHYYIVDRLKELIKYKGFQVAPAELEALLLSHPAVADAAVIPVADEEAGEVPKAFVVLEPGNDAAPDVLMAFVAERVAHYKQVRQLELVEAIPKSPSGKILRRLLRDRERR